MHHNSTALFLLMDIYLGYLKSLLSHLCDAFKSQLLDETLCVPHSYNTFHRMGEQGGTFLEPSHGPFLVQLAEACMEFVFCIVGLHRITLSYFCHRGVKQENSH